MKELVLREINNFQYNTDPNVKQYGIDAEKAIHKINCFVCMDTQQLWAWRRDAVSTSIFSRHKYDLIKCNGCSSGADIKTMASKEGFQKNDKSNINGRIDILVDLYHSKIKPEEEKRAEDARIEKARQEKLERERKETQRKRKQQEIYESDPNSVWGPGRFSRTYQHATNKTFEADVQKLANIVYDSIKIYGGDYTAVASIAKNIMLTFTSSISEVDETDEMIGSTEPDEYGNRKFTIVKLSKSQKQENRKYFGLVKSKTQEYTLCATYLVLVPKNAKARNECNSFISGEMTKFIEKMECS